MLDQSFSTFKLDNSKSFQAFHQVRGYKFGHLTIPQLGWVNIWIIPSKPFCESYTLFIFPPAQIVHLSCAGLLCPFLFPRHHHRRVTTLTQDFMVLQSLPLTVLCCADIMANYLNTWVMLAKRKSIYKTCCAQLSVILELLCFIWIPLILSFVSFLHWCYCIHVRNKSITVLIRSLLPCSLTCYAPYVLCYYTINA